MRIATRDVITADNASLLNKDNRKVDTPKPVHKRSESNPVLDAAEASRIDKAIDRAFNNHHSKARPAARTQAKSARDVVHSLASNAWRLEGETTPVHDQATVSNGQDVVKDRLASAWRG